MQDGRGLVFCDVSCFIFAAKMVPVSLTRLPENDIK